jgi:hypothetical protein
VDADRVLWSELTERGITDIGQLSPDEIVELALRYAVWVPVDTYLHAPWLAPYAVRKIRIRTDPRAPGPKRDLWGFPDQNGYFTDDNSLIKGVFRNRSVESASSPYGSAKFATGLVCCHVWAGTTTEPLLFSFIPNLVWLPRTLAPFSDAHQAGPAHVLHHTLKCVSTDRYRTIEPVVAAPRAHNTWRLLQADDITLGVVPRQNEFVVGDKLVNLVNTRLRKLEMFLIATLDDAAPRPSRFSKRYHAGVGARIDSTVWPVQQAVSEAARRQLLIELKACC